MNSVINSQILYEPTKLSLGGRKEQMVFFNSNGTVNGGSSCQIRIPNLRNTYLDCNSSFLRFSVDCTIAGTVLPTFNTATPPVVINQANLRLSSSSAASFIQSIEILNDNVSIYKCDNANKIASIVQVCNTGLSAYNSKSVLDGSAMTVSGNLDGLKVVESYGNPATASTATLCVLPTQTFCINNGIFGLLGENILPINQIRNGLMLRVEFVDDVRIPYKANQNSATITNTGSTMKFSEISYVVDGVVLDDSAQEAVSNENGFGERPIMYSGIIRRCSVLQSLKTNFNSTQTLSRLIPNNRYVSLNNILMGSFVLNGHSDGNTPVFPYNSILYKYQGQQIPNQKVDSLSQILQNSISCFSNVSPSVSSTVMDSTHSIINYRPPAVTVAETSTPRLVSGVDFTTWNDDNVISGVDTSSGDTVCELGITAAASGFDFSDCFVSTFSCIWVINDGVVSCSFN